MTDDVFRNITDEKDVLSAISNALANKDILPDVYKVIDVLKHHYPDIEYRVMDEMDNDEMIDRLDGTWEMANHDDHVKKEYYENDLHELIQTMWNTKVDLGQWLRDYNSDEMWALFCDAFGIGYYNKSAFEKHWKEFQEKLFNSTYNQLCERFEKEKRAT